MPSRACPSGAGAPRPSPGPALGYVGLDVSQAEVVACLLLPDGREVGPRWTVPNTAPGAQALAERVAVLVQAHDLRGLRIGLEATGLYWWHLACFLNETPLLTPWQPEVYVLNPQVVHGLRPLYGDQGKTDRRDAFLIAERVRLGRLPAPFLVDVL